MCNSCKARVEAEEHARKWNRYAWLFRIQDRFTDPDSEDRRRLWQQATGDRVLEIGVGTGRDMDLYPDDGSVTGVDISETMLEAAGRRAEDLGLDVDLERMDVRDLAFDDGTFDTVISTVTLCCCPDVEEAIAEVRRVLAPDGQFAMLENVRADARPVAKFQDLTAPLAERFGGGYFYRDTPALVREQGFTLAERETTGPFGTQEFVLARPGS